MMRYWNDSWLCGPGAYFRGPWAMIFNLAFWLLVIFLAIWLVQKFFRSKGPRPDPSPLEVLRHRYASGEIDREEFERMKKELRA